MRQLKLLIAAFMATLALCLPAAVLAQNPLDAACTQSGANSAVCNQAAAQGTKDPIAGPDGIISKVANVVAIVAIIGGIIMILIGGLFYVTSAGNPENAKKAKDRILSAIIGILIVALAWFIVRFISDRILA